MTVEQDSISKEIFEDAQSKILQLSLGDKEITEFQLEMINSHKERGLVEVQKFVFNQNLFLKYDITGYENFTDYINNSEVTRENISDMFLKIADIVLNCGDLLLEPQNFILDKEYIYIDSDSKAIKLINVPVSEGYNSNINDSYLDMILDVVRSILLESKIKVGDADYFIKIKNVISDIQQTSNYTIEDLKKKLLGMNINKNSDIYHNPTAMKEVSASQEKRNNQKITTTYDKPKTAVKPTNNVVYKPNPAKPVTQAKKVQQKESFEVVEKEKFTTARLIIAAVIQPLFITVMLLALIADGIDLAQKGAGIVLVLVLDILVLRIVLDKSKKIKVKVKVKTNTTVCKPAVEEKKVPKNNTKSESTKIQQTLQNNDSTTLLESETTILSAQPYLIDKNTNLSRTIDTTPFVIGRQAQLSDWMTTKGISRNHAEIIKNGNDYFIKDLNSSNGTILNGNKLIPEQMVKLEPGDTIELPGLILNYNFM